MNAFYDELEAEEAEEASNPGSNGFLEGGDAPALIRQSKKSGLQRPAASGEIVPEITYPGGHNVRKYPAVLKDDYEDPYAVAGTRGKRQVKEEEKKEVHPVKVNYKSLQRVTATSKYRARHS